MRSIARRYLAFVPVAFCDEARREDARTFFSPRIEAFDGGARAMAQALEGLDLCIARIAAEQPGVAAFLKKY
jgi:hypothetical protein